MRARGFGVLIALASATACLSQEYVAVGLANVRNPEREVGRILRAHGTVVEKDPVSEVVFVRLNAFSRPSDAFAALEKQPGVVVARRADLSVNERNVDFRSAASVTRLLAELKARNKDREAMAKASGKPLPAKTQLIKTGYLEAYLFWLEERAYPRKEIDVRAYERALRHRDRMPPAFERQEDLSSTPLWGYVGPRNLDIPYRTYYGLRPIIGRVGALVADPSNPSTLYLGGSNGGVWKSTDGGINWTPLTDGWPIVAVSSIAIDPSNPNTVYVGTGDFHGSRIYSMGIMKSTDGGNTWTQYGQSQFGNRAISSIQIDPDNPQRIVITTGRGSGGAGFVWRSTNGGLTWSSVLNTSANWCASAIGALDGSGQRAFYVSGSGTGGNVWRSMDRGATWTKLTTPASSGSHSVVQVAASPTAPGTVYIVVNADRKVFRSTDYGANWTDITAGFPNGTDNYFWSQSSYNWFLGVSTKPGPVDVIYVGMIDAAMSPDGGATWRSIGGPTYVSTALTHNDQQSFSIDPSNPNVVYIGSDGGAYRYTYNPSTDSGAWSYLSANLGITMFYKFDLHPTSTTWMLGGTQDNATPVARGDLANWANRGGGDGGFTAINPANPNVQYTEAQNLYVYRTGNAWNSQSVIAPSVGSDRVAFIAPLTLDPNNPNLLYAGTNYLWRRDDATGVWEPRLGGVSLSTGTVRFIAVAPGDGNRIYTSGSDGQVWMTSDKGLTWTQINTGNPGLPNRVINYISVNPANKDDVLVSVAGTGTGHLYRCANTTAPTRIWQNLSGSGATALPDVSTNTVVRDPFDFENVFYVGNDLGAFVTQDGGATWANATWPLGLPNVQVNDLKVHLASNRLYAATYGRGIWTMDLAPIAYPSSVTVVRGYYATGTLNDLFHSDDKRYVLAADVLNPVAEVQFSSTSPIANPRDLHFFLEASATRPYLFQELALYNFGSGQWQGMDSRNASQADTRFIVRVVGNASPFVHPVTREVRAKVIWRQVNDLEYSTDGWGLRVDRAVWRVVP